MAGRPLGSHRELRRDALVATRRVRRRIAARVRCWFNDTPSSPPEVSPPFSFSRSTMRPCAGWPKSRHNPTATHWLTRDRPRPRLRDSRYLAPDNLAPARSHGHNRSRRVVSGRRRDSLGDGRAARRPTGHRCRHWPTGDKLLVALPRTGRPGVVIRPPFALAASRLRARAEVTLEGVEVDEVRPARRPRARRDVAARVPSAPPGSRRRHSPSARLTPLSLRWRTSLRSRSSSPSRSRFCAKTGNCFGTSSSLRPAASPVPLPSAQIRSGANTLVLRSTQAYLTVMKGTGFLKSEPAQRWARQALFFLVWSCPTPVAHAAIRDLVGLCQV